MSDPSEFFPHIATKSQLALAAASVAHDDGGGLKETAKRYGVSYSLAGQAKWLLVNASPDLVQAVRIGELTIYQATHKAQGIAPPPVKPPRKIRRDPALIFRNCLLTLEESLSSLEAVSGLLSEEQRARLVDPRRRLSRLIHGR